MTDANPIETMIRREVAKTAPAAVKAALPREFEAFGDDRYSLSIADLGITLEIDRLRRQHGELIGELSARCALPGARAVNGTGVISIADLNLSSARARTDRAKLLASRANTRDLDWIGVVEDFASACYTPTGSDSRRWTFGNCRGHPAMMTCSRWTG